MRHVLSFLSLACAAFFGATAAMADGSLKDGPAPEAMRSCDGGAFSGPYIGASIGFVNHDDDKEDLQLIGNNFGDSESSVAGGLHYGYNIQCGRFVFGVESDFGFFDAETSELDPLIGAPCGGPCVPSTLLESDINWYSTSRLRLGLVHNDNLMFYITGGLAYADVDRALSDPIILPGGFSESHSDKQWGWTLGGGVEMVRHEKWLLRAEAMYVDLGSETETYVATGCGIGTCTTSYDWEDTFWVGRIGLSYRFGGREELAVAPLK